MALSDVCPVKGLSLSTRLDRPARGTFWHRNYRAGQPSWSVPQCNFPRRGMSLGTGCHPVSSASTATATLGGRHCQRCDGF